MSYAALIGARIVVPASWFAPLLVISLIIFVIRLLMAASADKKRQPTNAPNAAPTAAPQAAPRCPGCGGSGSWLADQQRWGCNSCRRFLDVPATQPVETPASPVPQPPFCPRCGTQGRWLADAHVWGCDRCRQVIA
jgi:hypothetical protein